MEIPFRSAPSPESLGIPSTAISAFLDRLDAAQLQMHGILILRHGQVAAEGYWAPFSKPRFHRMYSVSKSMVAIAVGLMVDSGKLNLNDRAATFFSDKLPHTALHPYLANTTIRDLLMMATPHSQNAYTVHDEDWLWAFWNKEPSHPSGTIFSYDTAATVVLTAIVERLSGKPFLDFMRPLLLDEIGFSKEATCIKTPEGYSWGGSGVLCTLRDMAKLAYLLMNNGRWMDKQLLSREYVEMATSRQIDNGLSGQPGYGFQIWMEPDGFSFFGMGSQHAFCYPDHGLLVATIADTQLDVARARPIIHENLHLLRAALSDTPLPNDNDAQACLANRLQGLTLMVQPGCPAASIQQTIQQKVYCLNDNPMGIHSVKFSFAEASGDLVYWDAQGEHCIHFGLGHNERDTLPEKGFRGQIGVPDERRYDCLNSAAWVESNKLCIRLQVVDDYLGTALMTFSFSEDAISVHMAKSAEWFMEQYQGFAGGVIQAAK